MSKVFQWSLVGLMVITSFLMMSQVSLQESATMDELAHIPSGYSYVKFLDYRLNPEHPPLVKALAGFPLIFQKLNFPTNSSAWTTDVNGQWDAGTQFLYQSGNNADQIIRWARVGPMILTLLLIIFIFIWASEIMGGWWALLPTFLFALSPNVLAHGHYVTTDIGAALGIFIATFYFVKFLLRPTAKYIVFAGLTLGIAQLMKFSAFLLIPFFVFLLIVYLIWKTKNDSQRGAWLQYLLKSILVLIIALVVIYAVYALFTLHYPVQRQISDTKQILGSFAGGPKPGTCQGLRCVAETNISMAGNKLSRPLAQYMLGLMMVFQRATGGNTAYFLGQTSNQGWWYYFPTVFVLKETIPTLILIGLALLIALISIFKNIVSRNAKRAFSNYLGTDFSSFAMIAFVIFYWAYSMKSNLNIGIRHIFPTLPFIYILSTDVIKKWFASQRIDAGNIVKIFFSGIKRVITSSAKAILITGLLIWFIIEVFVSYPYFLSYFNEFGNGVWGGYKYVVDSNYDWGQDLKRLETFVEKNKIDKIAVEYFGGGNPKYYLGNKEVNWWSAKGNPAEENIHYFAVSVGFLQSASGKLPPGSTRKSEDEYLWLKAIKNIYKPDFKTGTSIFIYKL
ncbi:MAG: glycosyltransferase family 39 protein [Candidatus Paceibacterota bacterium]|jgi:hypothetical protein